MRASDKAKKIWKYLIESESWLRRNILIASPHLTTPPREIWKNCSSWFQPLFRLYVCLLFSTVYSDSTIASTYLTKPSQEMWKTKILALFCLFECFVFIDRIPHCSRSVIKYQQKNDKHGSLKACWPKRELREAWTGQVS